MLEILHGIALTVGWSVIAFAALAIASNAIRIARMKNPE